MKANNQGQSTKGGEEEKNNQIKDTNQTKPGKELKTTQVHSLAMAD